MVEIMQNRPDTALLTLSPMEPYIQNCSRIIDGIHLNVLTAIALRRKKDERWSERLTAELQILHLLCADKSNAEIAQIMDVKLPTVKNHVSHILDKLDVKRRAEAKTAAKKLHLVPEEL